MKLKQLLFFVGLTALVPVAAKEITNTEETEQVEQKQESKLKKALVTALKVSAGAATLVGVGYGISWLNRLYEGLKERHEKNIEFLKEIERIEDFCCEKKDYFKFLLDDIDYAYKFAEVTGYSSLDESDSEAMRKLSEYFDYMITGSRPATERSYNRVYNHVFTYIGNLNVRTCVKSELRNIFYMIKSRNDLMQSIVRLNEDLKFHKVYFYDAEPMAGGINYMVKTTE